MDLAIRLDMFAHARGDTLHSLDLSTSHVGNAENIGVAKELVKQRNPQRKMKYTSMPLNDFGKKYIN